MFGLLRSLWSFRGYVARSILADFKTRFVRSRLGFAWVVLNPLAQVCIYAFILSGLMSSRIPGIDNTFGYAIYLLSGLLAWNLFAEIVDRLMKVFIANANTIKKVRFPRIVLPVIAVGTALINNAALFVVMCVLFALFGYPVGPQIALVIPAALLVALFAACIGLALGVLNVFIRDIEQVVPILLQVLFWFTPIIYPVNIIPERFHSLLELSPMFHIVDSYHRLIVYAQPVALDSVLYVIVLVLLLFPLALFLFRQASAEMVDVL
ncbi:MAG: transporter permease [Devosia sp.]|nr:transporter permease [Devosia sp.]